MIIGVFYAAPKIFLIVPKTEQLVWYHIHKEKTAARDHIKEGHRT